MRGKAMDSSRIRNLATGVRDALRAEVSVRLNVALKTTDSAL